jgi:beta-phosphoglucomutase-like phosphatase (HAD superfamily)
VIIAGDDVSNKKPHPEIYNVAAQRLGLASDACVVAEDSISSHLISSHLVSSRLTPSHPKPYHLPRGRCVVVEDSIVGLRAAKAAGMKCVITYTPQTVAEDFYALGADAKMLDFGTVGGGAVQELFAADGAVLDELLVSSRDAK